MNYALAKELKEAGFPQPPKDRTKIYFGFWYANLLGKDDVYAPSLSELIEACGTKFEALYRQTGSPEWHAITFEAIEWATGQRIGAGATPEEAVARLWLALNK